MSDQINVKHKIGDTCRKLYSYFKTVNNTSTFIQNGTLTPSEFVDSGDFLVYKFKTWEWQEADKDRVVPYLPENKQFLITKNVPCKQRIKDLNNIVHDLIYNYEEEEEDDNCDEAIDINNFYMENNLIKEHDPASINSTSCYSKNMLHDNLMKIRTYDVSITYDKYYQTPRIWLFGYNENGDPLKSEEIFEDILSDYSYKTVTYDPHPCTGVMTASIHPCKHAEAILNVVNNWISEEKEPRHDLYLLFLLKFISGVIPTIEYDFTTDIEIPRDSNAGL
ncbi:hypothetical protein PFTANZ_02411 [Plasmodium falciparum Tanzania (2000708)]|uniref:Uncharacterized protein n=1 Tax=Plasmodium falciparum Tanzania (2000708) TaxID=1036725 RepID=A0A024W8C9_PLAFA|nr:hypothetical protein PFTANZ_02411 [Plasmodium falciparum Tanzania (2000708)]